LTHVDDGVDPSIRDAIGVNAASALPLLDHASITFLVEDPATTWHLGPERYRGIAERYNALTQHHEKLAIDLNIADRYQNVYPTKQQTGTELLQLVHLAAANFKRVALYSEASLLPPDLRFLSSAATAVTRVEQVGSKLVVDSMTDVGIPWTGDARVDGDLWPAADGHVVWLPAGAHSVESAQGYSGPRLIRLTGELQAARAVGVAGMEFSYLSSARAIAVFSRPPRRIQIDGADERPLRAGAVTLLLPKGQHVVTVFTE
jgi:hypothetical protein